MQSQHSPNIPNLKAQARRYRAMLVAQGRPISHSRALELVAKQIGLKDWNTASAKGKAHAVPGVFSAGSHIRGRYLGNAFNGSIIASSQLSEDEILVTIDLWEPIDVATSSRISALRKRISGRINLAGKSAEQISSGDPVLEIEPGSTR